MLHILRNVKSFPSNNAHRLALISLAIHQFTLRVITDTRLMYRAVFLFMSQFSLVLIAPVHGGMARLS